MGKILHGEYLCCCGNNSLLLFVTRTIYLQFLQQCLGSCRQFACFWQAMRSEKPLAASAGACTCHIRWSEGCLALLNARLVSLGFAASICVLSYQHFKGLFSSMLPCTLHGHCSPTIETDT